MAKKKVAKKETTKKEIIKTQATKKENHMFENVKDSYILCNIDSDFAISKRTHLRYACEYLYASLMELNPAGIDPFEYLNFAKSDISTSDLRGAVNAIGNAKRAIHLTTDCFFEILGMAKVIRKSNFPAKLDIIRQLEAFPINIINSLNIRRNYMEHGYRTVNVNEATNFVDIAEMFLRLCYPMLKHMVVGIHVGLKSQEEDINWILNPEKRIIKVYKNLGSKSFDSPIGVIYYNFSDRECDRKLLKTIDIRKSNLDEWLPYLNVFVYCTKKAIIPKNPLYDPKGYERLMFFSNIQSFF